MVKSLAMVRTFSFSLFISGLNLNDKSLCVFSAYSSLVILFYCSWGEVRPALHHLIAEFPRLGFIRWLQALVFTFVLQEMCCESCVILCGYSQVVSDLNQFSVFSSSSQVV